MMETRGVVIGAGVVGLACAAALSRRGCPVLVLERRAGAGQGVSSRSSEVIHAGLYYPPGSLKALTCIEGRERLYQRCTALGLPHRRTGKLVVACSRAEIQTLEQIRERGERSGAGRLEILSAEDAIDREPRVRARAALWSPESGIVDSHALIGSYQAEAESGGSEVVLRTTVVGLQMRGDLWRVRTRDAEGEHFSVDCGFVVNAAGLEADRVAGLAGIDVDAEGWRIRPCKGDYFSVAPELGRLTRGLVYPVPVEGGLGIHVTVDLGGRTRLGPDVEYVDLPTYDVDGSKAERFAREVGRFLPEIRSECLSPEFAGIRPKLQGPGEAFRDFVIDDGRTRGLPGLVSLVGIESPGLTAAGAIAERVADWLVGPRPQGVEGPRRGNPSG